MFTGKEMRRFAIVFALFWVFLVLYPQPLALGQSIYRLFNPPVNAHAVKKMLTAFHDKADPAAIEKSVLELIPYKYDWQTYNCPWYFPTAQEAVQKGRGDCKTRFIILASVFEAFDISYELYISLNHIWINYGNKMETAIENENAVIYAYDGETFNLKLPQIDLLNTLDVFWDAFWVYMPPKRKNALLAGLAFSALLFFTPCQSGNVWGQRKEKERRGK